MIKKFVCLLVLNYPSYVTLKFFDSRIMQIISTTMVTNYVVNNFPYSYVYMCVCVAVYVCMYVYIMCVPS